MNNEEILGIFTLLSAFFGFFTNWSVVLFMREVPVLRSSFGYLSAHGALATAIYCTIVLFWVTPMMLFDIQWLKTHSHNAGYFLYLCYDLTVQTQFLMCLNRFIAVCFPMKYPVLFHNKSTIAIIACLWTICLSISLFVFPFSHCQMYYESSALTIVYTPTPKCQRLTFYADFVLHIGLVTVMIVLNSITFYQFRKKNRTVFTTLTHVASLRKAQSERNFLRQTLYQGGFYIVALLTYFLLAPFLEQDWLRFLFILLPWYFLHAYEAMVTILCNPELKKLCFRKWSLGFSKPQPPSTGKTLSTHTFKV